MDYNMTAGDAPDAYGRISAGRQYDFIGDAITEQMILNDGDESLDLGYFRTNFHGDAYVGDMIRYKAELIRIGGSSRDCSFKVYKLAETARRAGAEYFKEGDMVWFDEPELLIDGTVRLVVKKQLQRGKQPEGTVAEPWAELEDFPAVAGDIKDRLEETVFRYRMSDRDVFYKGGVVNGARNLTLMEDCANRLMARVFHNTGRVAAVSKTRFYLPIAAGDYMEFHARLKRQEGRKAIIEVRAFRIIGTPENPPFESSVDVNEIPPLTTAAEYVYEIN